MYHGNGWKIVGPELRDFGRSVGIGFTKDGEDHSFEVSIVDQKKMVAMIQTICQLMKIEE